MMCRTLTKFIAAATKRKRGRMGRLFPSRGCRFFAALIGMILWLTSIGWAQGVPYQVAQAYEDTVRIVVIWTDAQGVCANMPPVGTQTRDFVLASIASVNPANVKVLPSSGISIAAVQALWPGQMPHVIVHIDAGWASLSGSSIVQVLSWAVQNWIGVVEIGDDAAYLTSQVFEWSYYNVGFGGNLPAPMYTAEWLNKPGDSLWIITEPQKDIAMDSTKYPFLTGIVRNATLKIMRGNTKLYFKDYGPADGRCEADPDSFLVPAVRPERITFLGYQQGWNATLDADDGRWPPAGAQAPVNQGLVGLPEQFITITAFQDSVSFGTRFVIRRAVALSYEPQFLRETIASQQIVYDAIMFASLAHTLKPVAVKVQVSSDTITAGQLATLNATILPEDLDAATKQQMVQSVQWKLVPGLLRTNDTITAKSGPQTQSTGTQAFRYLYVVASLYDSAFQAWVYDTAKIWVKPGPDCRVWIERSSATPIAQVRDIMPRTYLDSINPRPLDSIVLTSNMQTVYAYAVVRDCYGNIKRVASNGIWQALDPPNILTAVGTSGKLWEGVITRITEGVGYVRASEATLIADTVKVVVEPAPRVDLVSAVTGDIDGNGYIDHIVLAFDSVLTLPGVIATAGFEVKYGNTRWMIDTIYTRSAGGTDSVVIIRLQENTGGGFQTDWIPTVSMPGLGLAGAVKDFPTTDGVGPVIERAMFFPMTLGGGVDTLLVYFSEPVVWVSGAIEPVNAYYYYDSAGRSGAAFLNIPATQTVIGADSAMVFMVNGYIIRPMRDSVQLISTFQITDAAGNKAPGNGRRAVIEWGGKSELKVVALNNPFVLGAGAASLPEVVQRYYSGVLSYEEGGLTTPGVLTAVRSVKPLEEERPGSGVFGTAVIYDAVGNVVIDDLKLRQASLANPRDYAVFWNGRNRNGRLVGGGTYLMVVKARDIDGKSISQRVKIGVKLPG